MESISNEDLCREFTRKSADLHRAILEYPEVRAPPAMRHNTRTTPSSAGTFDLLPLEIIHNIFQSIDLRSLQNVACTSVQARILVESLPDYRNLVTHATSSITALSRTGMITEHSTSKVHHALLCSRCSVCGDYAPLLYMPTCERCCLNCLFDERPLRMMAVTAVRLCFGLTPKEADKLPKLSTVPGPYGVQPRTYTKQMLLISAKHAEAAAISKYGSRVAMERAVQQTDEKRMARYRERLQRARSSLETISSRWPPVPATAAKILDDPNDRYRFLGATPMPSLSDSKEVEVGTWCLGCYDSWRGFVSHELHPGYDDSFQEGDDARNRILRRERRAFDRAELLEHLPTCPGAIHWLKNGN